VGLRWEAVWQGPLQPGFRLFAESHDDTTLRVELDDHIGSFINQPDVVSGIHTDRMSHLEAVQTLTDLAQILKGLVKLK
jgi:hypothetical protein